MNERIRELAEQAREYATARHPVSNIILSVNSDLFEQKFAELIVKECMDQCEKIRDDAYTQKKSEYLTESGRLIYEGVFGGATNCGFAIHQHFGVEE